jgi:hypothetical protein
MDVKKAGLRMMMSKPIVATSMKEV